MPELTSVGVSPNATQIPANTAKRVVNYDGHALVVFEGPDAQCAICCEWGHTELRCGAPGMARCGFCAGQHKTVDHECKAADYRTHKGKAYKHVQAGTSTTRAVPFKKGTTPCIDTPV